MTILMGCSSMNYQKTVENVDIQRYMGKWYVIAGRFTMFEKGVHNGVELYTWNEEKKRIDIQFTYNKDSLDGKVKSIPQKGWVMNNQTGAHWEISPMWPFRFTYLIIDLADDYSWTVIGVPSGNYLWIMARDKSLSKSKIQTILDRLKGNGYPIKNITYVPHS